MKKTRVFLADLVTGDNLIDIPHKGVSWETRRASAETIDCDITLAEPLHRRLDLRNAAAVAHSVLTVVENDRVVAQGPVWDHEYDQDTKQFSVGAVGWQSFLSTRFVLPPAAQYTPILIPDGEDAGQPNPVTNTVIEGAPWPNMVRRIIQQSTAWPGGELPFVYGPDGVGAHDKSYDGSAFKTVESALDDLQKLVDGPEISFDGRVRADMQGIEVFVQVGDDTKLTLGTTLPIVFDFSAPKRSVRRLRIQSSADGMTGEAWGTAGRQAGTALWARAFDSFLTDHGYPFMQSVNTSHPNVSDQGTLDQYVAEDALNGRYPTEFWSFEARADSNPKVGEYRVGDIIELRAPNNDPFIPPGPHLRRIAGLSRAKGSRWVGITTDEVREAL